MGYYASRGKQLSIGAAGKCRMKSKAVRLLRTASVIGGLGLILTACEDPSYHEVVFPRAKPTAKTTVAPAPAPIAARAVYPDIYRSNCALSRC